MTFRIRAASPADLQPLYDMAKLTGGDAESRAQDGRRDAEWDAGQGAAAEAPHGKFCLVSNCHGDRPRDK